MNKVSIHRPNINYLFLLSSKISITNLLQYSVTESQNQTYNNNIKLHTFYSHSNYHRIWNIFGFNASASDPEQLRIRCRYSQTELNHKWSAPVKPGIVYHTLWALHVSQSSLITTIRADKIETWKIKLLTTAWLQLCDEWWSSLFSSGWFLDKNITLTPSVFYSHCHKHSNMVTFLDKMWEYIGIR